MRYRVPQHFDGSIVCITDNAAGGIQSSVMILGFQVQDHSTATNLPSLRGCPVS